MMRQTPLDSAPLPVTDDWTGRRIDPADVMDWLRREAVWPAHTALQSLRVSRWWPGRRNRLSFELTLTLAERQETTVRTLQGGVGSFTGPVRQHRHIRMDNLGLTGLRLASKGLQLWCCTPDRDHKLRGVRQLLDPPTCQTVLANTSALAMLGIGPPMKTDATRLSTKLITYRANKRCVLRIRRDDGAGTPGVFVKVFRRPPTEEQVEQTTRLEASLRAHSNGQVCLPTIIDWLPERGLLVTEEIPQPTCPISRADEDAAAVARALALLHGSPDLIMTRKHTPFDEMLTVNRWIQALPLIYGETADRLQAIAHGIAGLLPSHDDVDMTLIHRDFYSAQLLRQGDRIWLVDFDTLCTGHAELDVATYVAHLVFDALRARGSVDGALQQAACFVHHYRTYERHVDRPRLAFYLACALARLGAIQLSRATDAVAVSRSGENDTEHNMIKQQAARQLWALAEQVLDGPDLVTTILSGTGGA